MNVRFGALSAHKSLCRWRSLPPFAERVLWNSPLLRRDVGRADHLAPLFGLVGNEFSEFGRRH
jgi:hypothetical protein